MRRILLFFVAGALLSGSADAKHPYKDAFGGKAPQQGEAIEKTALDPALEERILALDPERISEADVKEILSKAPAPQILNIHGGIYPVYLCMISFSEFLIRMGYPEEYILQPGSGSFSYSCYFDARPLAGALAWHYERTGLRPMLVGHSQGGIQVMKVLHELAGHFTKSVPVWSPLTGKQEKRDWITDPFTGEKRAVTALSASFASAVGAGGLTRLLPNQWVMNAGLRSVPDSVGEFTGFRVEGDFLGGDLFGVSGSNQYRPHGTAKVRNLALGVGHDHVTIPNTKHLSLNPDARKWIEAYHPVKDPDPKVALKGNTGNLRWAADVWYSIKKHWCLELQHVVRQRQKERPKKNGTMDPAPLSRRLLGRSGTARRAA
jgi:hypothetical protein